MIITTANRDEAIREMIIASEEPGGTFMCYLCGKKYKKMNSLRKHLESLHEDIIVENSVKVAIRTNALTKKRCLDTIDTWFAEAEAKYKKLKEEFAEKILNKDLISTLEWSTENILKKAYIFKEVVRVQNMIDHVRTDNPGEWVPKLKELLEETKKEVTKEIAEHPFTFNSSSLMHNLAGVVELEAKSEFWVKGYEESMFELKYAIDQYIRVLEREAGYENPKTKDK